MVAEANQPAGSFYFVISPNGAAYDIGGEGNGDKAASDAAGDELARLTPEQITALLAETKAVGRPGD